MNIYIAGPLGFETAKKLYKAHKDEIDARFPSFYIRQFEAIENECVCPCGLPEGFVQEIGEGGLERALWELGEVLGCGLSVDVKSIPVHQEIIEIMELFGQSPYDTSSAGAVMIAAEEAEGASQIGRTNKGKARVLQFADTKRYLTPPSRQAKDIADRQSHR